MKKTLLINQEVLSSFSDLDFGDAAILHYLLDFSHVAKKMIDQNTTWFWVSSEKIIEDLPLLRINSKRGISKRIDKLIDSGLLKRHPDNQNLAHSFYRFTKEVAEVLGLNENSTLGTVVPNPQEQPFQTPWNNRSNNNSITDNSIIDSSKATPEKSGSLFPETEPDRLTLFSNSVVGTFESFGKKFKGPEFQEIDLFYYFNSVSDWSDKANKKRTARGWLATARDFMRRDLESGKLKKIGFHQDQAGIDPALMAYLKM